VPAAGVEAGIAAFQNENYWYAFGVQREGDHLRLSLRRHRGGDKTVVDSTDLPAGVGELKLKISGDGKVYGFAYDDGSGWKWLQRDVDGTLLSTDVAGGFIGATVGPYARRLDNQ
jgi:alpha-N-arabinofuranosidase